MSFRKLCMKSVAGKLNSVLGQNLKVKFSTFSPVVKTLGQKVLLIPKDQKFVFSRGAHGSKFSITEIWESYLKFLTLHPYIAQSIQTSLIMTAGDVIAQTIVEKNDFDVKRMLKFGFLGLNIGVVVRFWYGIMQAHIGTQGRLYGLKKCLVDQLFFAPLMMVLFFIFKGTLDGHSTDEIKEQFRRDYVTVLVSNYKVWPAIQLMNFYFIPLEFQVPLVQVVGLFWNTYLSYVTNQPVK